MREHAQIRNNVLHAHNALFNVLQGFHVFLLLFLGEVLSFVTQGKQASGREVERIVNFVNDSGAHPAQRGEFFRLNQLRFGLFQLLDR